MFKFDFKSQSGLTIPEILVVLVIMAILAVVGVIYLSGSVSSARDARRKEDLGYLQKVLTVYYIDHGFFPTSQTAGISPISCKISLYPTPECEELLEELRFYSAKIPFDPADNSLPGDSKCGEVNCYDYVAPDPAHSVSCICAQLENPTGVNKPPSCSNSSYNYCLQVAN